MDSQRLSQLIGLIYDSAQDLDLWPLLLQGLAEELEINLPQKEALLERLPLQADKLEQYVSQWYEAQEEGDAASDDKVRYFAGSEGELFGLLLPHLRRAVKINRELSELTIENQAFAAVLERLPIGMVVCDVEGRVQAKNRRFDQLLEMQQGLRLRAGQLELANRQDQGLLTELVEEVCKGPEEEHLGRALRLSGQQPVSLLILPLVPAGTPLLSPKVIIFVASLANDVEIENQTLQTLYGLTQAEARLTIGLVKGASLEEISAQHHVSTHTLRTQLKSIYAKTGSRRQAELVMKVLSSPAILSTGPLPSAAVLPAALLQELGQESGQRHTQSLFLHDGRRLCYAEYGPADGWPVVMMHTLVGSRLQLPVDESVLFRHGIRILAPDRPGIGQSDGQKGRTITDWGADVAELADALGLQSFDVMGFSIGACFALAAAAQLPERVRGVTLLSPIAEFHYIDEMDGIIPIFKMLLGLGKYLPALTLPFMRLMLRGVLRKPEKYYAHVVEQMPPADQQIFNAPGFREYYLPTTLEAVRNGEQGVITEQLMVARDWGIPLAELRQAVTIWHGDDDRHNPLYMARSIAMQLPRAELRVLPQAGHFLFYSHWDEIIANLAAARA